MRSDQQKLSTAQFEALAELLRLREGEAQQAARMVLVDGLTTSEAARAVGVSLQAVSNALTRCRKGIDLARRIVA